MIYKGKDIKSLADDELVEAIYNVAAMDNFRFDKLSDPRIKKPNSRLNKIFHSNPPIENVAFTNLVNALNVELENRKLLK